MTTNILFWNHLTHLTAPGMVQGSYHAIEQFITPGEICIELIRASDSQSSKLFISTMHNIRIQ